MRYRVTMHRWVPQYAQVDVEAGSEAEAKALARAEVATSDYWIEEAGLTDPPRDWNHVAIEEDDAPITPGLRIARHHREAA